MKELIRFSAVQKSWKSIAKLIIPHEIPWLIVSINPKELLTLDLENAFHQQFLEGLNYHLQNPNHQFLHNHLHIVNAYYRQLTRNTQEDRHFHLRNLVDNRIYKFKFPHSVTAMEDSDNIYVRTFSFGDRRTNGSSLWPNKRMKFSTYCYKNREAKMKSMLSKLSTKVIESKYGFYKWSDGMFNPFTGEMVWLPYLESHVSCTDLNLLRLDDALGYGLKDFCVAACINGNPAVWEPRLSDASDKKSRLWRFTGNYHIVGDKIEDTIINKGCLYEIVKQSLEVRVFDLKGGDSKKIELRFDPKFHKLYQESSYKFLVELRGELFFILMTPFHVCFKVFWLDLDSINWEPRNGNMLMGTLWHKTEHLVKDIGDYALFLSRHSSKALHVKNFMSRSVRRNCIYVMHPKKPGTLSVYSLRNLCVRPFVLKDKRFQIKFFPNLASPWLMGKFWEDESVELRNEDQELDGSALIRDRICSIPYALEGF
ncbi:unnamed protein product [Amaranthus hypochondriacus]